MSIYDASIDYQQIANQVCSLAEGCEYPLPLLANTSALLWETLPRINWVGFYLLRDSTLYLGPFQGKPACTMIPYGKGVCGTAIHKRSIQIVHDVHQFPGHIACDSASASEIVIPLITHHDIIAGVLDIDSPIIGRFTHEDAQGLSLVCSQLIKAVHWDSGII